MAGIAKGLQAAMSGYKQAGVFRKTAGFHRWKMRMKMNKLSNKPKLVGRDQFGNQYFEDSTESFGRNRWVEYARPNKFGGSDPGGVHDGTTDHGFDGSLTPNLPARPAPRGCRTRAHTTIPVRYCSFAGRPTMARVAALHERRSSRAAEGLRRQGAYVHTCTQLQPDGTRWHPAAATRPLLPSVAC